MNNKKSTKRALISSVLSLVLCMAMLIGTTYAWFTDSVTSSGNKIQAGNLDVDLYMWNGLEDNAANRVEITNESAPIFGAGSLAQDNNAQTLWEPGKTQVAYLSIKNNGSLDLKYKVAIDVKNSVNNLHEVMQYAITPDAKFGQATPWTTGTNVELGTNEYEYKEITLGVGEEHFFALSVHMLEEAGNEYMNGSVDFDIRVLATQLNSEEDSFGPDYDKLATYPGVAYEIPAVNETVPVNETGKFDFKTEDGSASFSGSASAGSNVVVKVEPKEDGHSTAVAAAEANGQALASYDIDVSGNEGEVTIDLYIGKGFTNVVVYHEGVDIPCEYNATTGVVTFKASTFSPFDIAYIDPRCVMTAEVLKQMVEAGNDVILGKDIDLKDSAIKVAKDSDVKINLNGHDLTGVTAKNSGNQKLFTVNGKLEIVGNGTISVKHTGANMGWSALTAVVSVEGGELTVGKGVTLVHQGGSDMAYGVDVNSTGGAATLNVNGATITSPYIGVRLFNNHSTAKATVNLNSGAIQGVSRDIWAQNPSAKAVDENAVVNIAESYEYAMTVQTASFNSRNYKFGVVVSTADELQEALKNADDNTRVVMNNDIVVEKTVTNGYGKTAVRIKKGTLDGNGYKLTVKNAGETWDSVVNLVGGTVKNLTAVGGFRGFFMGGANADVVIDNCSVENVVYTFNSDAGNKNYSVTIKNTELNGWTSFSNVHKAVTFINCEFGEGSGYAFCRPYNEVTTFENCEFSEGYKFDTTQCDSNFINCYYGETLITADNAATLKSGDVVFFYNGVKNTVIK